MSDLVIRLAGADDVDAIERIELAADVVLGSLLGLDAPFEAESALVRLEMPGFVLVAERGGEVVGFAHVVTDDADTASGAMLEQLAVAQAHTRSGIGRALVEAASAQTAARNVRSLNVTTFDGVGASPAFHAAVGFTPSAPRTAFEHDIEAAEIELGFPSLAPRLWLRLTFG